MSAQDIEHQETDVQLFYPATGSDWMSHISDDMPLNMMSLPGTHQSAAGGYKEIFDFVETQKRPLSYQLAAGIRVVDFRLNLYSRYAPGNSLMMTLRHGPYDMAHLSQAMDDVVQFLSRNPSECVLIRIKNEDNTGTDGSDANVIRGFEDYLRYRSYQQYRLIPSSGTLPTLGEARGKWLQISNISPLPGYDWRGAEIQDNWQPGSTNQKKNDALRQFEKSVRAERNHNRVFINFMSASTDPDTGPDTWADRMLPWLQGLISNALSSLGPSPTGWFRLGVVMMDFPHERWQNSYHTFAKLIYDNNSFIQYPTMTVPYTAYGFRFDSHGHVYNAAAADVTVVRTGRGYYSCRLGNSYPLSPLRPVILVTTYSAAVDTTRIATVVDYHDGTRSFQIIVEDPYPTNKDCGCMVVVMIQRTETG